MCYRISEIKEQSKLSRAREISTFGKGPREDSEGREILISSGMLSEGIRILKVSLTC